MIQLGLTYNQMDQIIIENAPIVPLYYDNILRFTQKTLAHCQIMQIIC